VKSEPGCFSTRSSSHLCLMWIRYTNRSHRETSKSGHEPGWHTSVLFPSGWFSISISCYAIARRLGNASLRNVIAEKINELSLRYGEWKPVTTVNRLANIIITTD